MLTGQLLPAPPPPARAASSGARPGRVAVRAALRSASAEVVAGVEADLQGFVQELFQGARACSGCTGCGGHGGACCWQCLQGAAGWDEDRSA